MCCRETPSTGPIVTFYSYTETAGVVCSIVVCLPDHELQTGSCYRTACTVETAVGVVANEWAGSLDKRQLTTHLLQYHLCNAPG